jgi:hypothetical protein
MEIKSYKKGDEHEILNLFRLSFNQEMSYNYWNWRFNDNPFSTQQFIQLMWDDDKLVGHYSLSPVELLIDGEVHQTALSMTTMTHPAYGGRGIFTQLAAVLYAGLEKQGYMMVWGFPNENSHYGFNKNLQWVDIATIPMLSLKTTNLKKEVYFDQYWSPVVFTADLASLLNNSDKAVKINKTAAYLNWRYITIPSFDYKMVAINGDTALLVYKVIQSFSDPAEKEVDIMEIQFNHDFETLKNLLTAVLHAEEKEEVIRFNIWNSIFSKNQGLLEKIGFKMALPVTYLGFLDFKNHRGTVENYKNWDINFGLSDVF